VAAPEPGSVSHPNIFSIGAVRPRVATGPRLLPHTRDCMKYALISLWPYLGEF
jgi:hypothetical protein